MIYWECINNMTPLKGGENMKKVLVGIVAIALVVSIGLGVKNLKNQAGDPPVGKAFKTFSTSQVALIQPFGDPPVG